MRCSDLIQLVTDYLEDALPADERRVFEEHLTGCVNCTTYVDQMRETVARLGGAEPEPVSDELCSHLLTIFRGVGGDLRD
jgi:anti-sigma factor RsiW